jgi:uncharacterized protein DUF4214
VSNTAVYTGNFTPATHLTASGSTAGLWKFDGQTKNDSSGNSNNGTLQGGATYSSDVPSGDGGGGSGPTADPYLQNFIQWALGRPPSTDEANYWKDILRNAYAHQQGSMLIALREMGRTIFESSDYAARSRSDHDYVHDLDKTFLLREPDSSGWAYWDVLVPSIGRDQVRRGFDESTEFANLVSTLTTLRPAILCNGDQVGVVIVVERDHSLECVSNALNITAPVVIDREIVAVAVSYLSAAILVIVPSVAEMCTVGGAKHQVAVIRQLQIRRVSRFIDVR